MRTARTWTSRKGRNLAVSYSIAGDSGHMSYHPGANTTSYITGRAPGSTLAA